jgi:dihydroorotate dehydrogenase
MATGPHTRLIAGLYARLLKPVLFQFDPEDVHDRFTNVGRVMGATHGGQLLTRALMHYAHPALHTEVRGIHFANPIGLAAGFDKNAMLTNILPDVGFGFEEVGSITGRPCAGNARPRLWRLPKSQGLTVYYGLKNDGADVLSDRLRNMKFRFPVGISAAKTNDKETSDPEKAIADYSHVLSRFRGIGDYFTINISCPNTFGGEPFTDPQLLDRLLAHVDELADKPVFLKLAVDLPAQRLDEIIEVCSRHRIDGFICSNLTKNRANMRIKDAAVPDKGGISGVPVRDLSDEQIRYIYRRTAGKYAIIGVGGVFSAEDAYRKIKLGASLVQLITGMVFRGPQVIGSINRGLVDLLHRDGYRHISEAVGVDNRPQIA